MTGGLCFVASTAIRLTCSPLGPRWSSSRHCLCASPRMHEVAAHS